ncbi:hypothetical protein SAMN04488028_11126 [Reichenbachiella agariperforans]|uniref:Uncharacterized protein n=1 Tax=Reichenbachiella agariperforans TaxID=156994 RepID=A0A1M6WB44_REIAG|nr:hypothetical protein [Reichenbachiella agariperforans]SHK90888.1 hypothetical protein SAMN04488028_11126 [Reichenbachiella agariperforans]
MADIDVTMTVDTVKLSAGDSVADCCTLSDNNGDPSGSEDFDIQGDTGQTVQFSIVAADGTTPVSFKEFRYEGGDSGVFDPMPSADEWTGTIAGVKGQQETYYIDFYVPSIQTDFYTLDPRVDVKGP